MANILSSKAELAEKLLTRVREKFIKDYKEEKEEKVEKVDITTKSGKLVTPKSYDIQGRLAKRIKTETIKFLTINPVKEETFLGKLEEISSTIASKLTEFELRRLGGKDVYTKTTRALDIPLIGQAYHAAYNQVLKAECIGVPDYDSNKQQIKEIINSTLNTNLLAQQGIQM
jgi:hypothetical protein